MTGLFAIRCPACSCREGEGVAWGEDLLLRLPGRFAVVRCTQCGLHQSWPELALESLREYYPESYYGTIPQPPTIKHREYLLGLGRRLYRRIAGGAAVSYLGCRLPPSWVEWVLPMRREPGALLDVGAGVGRFVGGAKSLGWRPEALDMGSVVVRVGGSLNIPVYQGTLEEIIPQLHRMERRYDLMSLNHVLEHLPCPVRALRGACEVLADGGVIRIQIPLWRQAFVRIFRTYWSALDLPRHRWHFSPADIRRIAKEVGLDRTLYLPETGTHPLSSSLRLWMRDHPWWQRWQGIGSVDNHLTRGILFPLGWCLAVLGRPLEATFYLMRA